ncbi:efflux RND transporter periplasmic adaptor subunit [Phyllobacterium leguminum]|uniref:Macrolide-specific efflux system membrane fusion protein n=1 Tax=Phyllobacterium leguminum TaxID=314237 RepID=A0A318SWX6_9HYPH|nr:efflux RND transporter periplasmic adaptor subunit [Phyllobacterium leguminum]PYE86475.1 macrolide-specific efflux system membrane fusion protein [Phyllobacterium leguminum]
MKRKPQRRFRWRLWLAVLTALLVAGYFIVRSLTREEPLPPTIAIKRGDIESSVLATGTLRPKKLVAIGAQATGRILSLKVQPGQQVKAGEVVALIDSTNQLNQLNKAQATLRQNEATRDQNMADLELAKEDLARNQMMIGKNAVARADYDKAVSTVKSKQAQVANSEAAIDAAQVDVQIAETNLTYTRITAPIGGTILATVVQEGQTVNAQQSAPTIAILGQLDTMAVEADISEADITKVRVGMPLYFTIAGQDFKRYDAKLEKIEPAPDSIVNDKSFSTTASVASSASPSASAIYYKGIFNVPNPDGLLRTYMTAEVHIILANAKNVLIAPVSALKDTDQPNKATVQVLVGNKLEERTVETGITDKINTEILSGLKEGDKVVVDANAPVSSRGALML